MEVTTLKERREQVLHSIASLLGASSGDADAAKNTEFGRSGHAALVVDSNNIGMMGQTGFLGQSAHRHSSKKGLISHLNRSNPAALCILPSLDLFSGDIPDLSALGVTDAKHPIVAQGALNLAEPITWTRSSCAQAPITLLRTLSLSLSSIIDARMRSCTLVLLRHSLERGDNRSRSRLLALLSTSSTIAIQSMQTTFTIANSPAESDDPAKVSLPVSFEAKVDVSVRGKSTSVRLQTTGTIGGTFVDDSTLMDQIQVTFDTRFFMEAMVEQARIVAVQAVATATTLPGAGGLNIPAQLQPTNNQSSTSAMPKVVEDCESDSDLEDSFGLRAPSAALQSFASMKLVSKMKGGSAAKNTSSLLLNGSSKSGPTLGKGDRNRSVTFLTNVQDGITTIAEQDDSSAPMSNVESVKRRKLVALTPSNLRSSKSFGKPNAELFENSRNATFADFGRGEKSKHIPSFANAHQKAATAVSGQRNNTMTRNATFSHLNREEPASAGINSSFGLSRAAGTRPMEQTVPVTTPTAAALPPPQHNSLLASFAATMAGGGIRGTSIQNFDSFLNKS